MSTASPTVPDSHPNVPSTYHQVLAPRGSSENTLRERESSGNGQGSNSADDDQKQKNENSDNDAEEKAQEGSMKHVGFWDPSLAKTRKWVILHWLRTSTSQTPLQGTAA